MKLKKLTFALERDYDLDGQDAREHFLAFPVSLNTNLDTDRARNDADHKKDWLLSRERGIDGAIVDSLSVSL